MWIEALETIVYKLNRVPAKAVSNTPFELFKGWKSSFWHIHFWGCLSKLRICNPQEKKLEPRTISGYFIGYAEKSKGYRFFCPSYNTRIVESRNVNFLKNNLISGSDLFQDITLERSYYKTQPSGSNDRLVVINAHSFQDCNKRPMIQVPQMAEDDNVDWVISEGRQVNVAQLIE